MARKRTLSAADEPEIPVGVPDRRPKNPKARCEVCTDVGPKATLQFCLRRTGKPPGKPIGNAQNVCQLMRGLADVDRESFWALHLDVRNHVVDIDKVAVGTQTGVTVHPREVFRSALLSGATSMIFVHNHPSGNPLPSRQDEELTDRLKAVGDLTGIDVLDHIIVGRDGCESMAARSRLEGNKTATYIPLAEREPKKRG
jgi:DNA repair protein RadC